MEKYGRIIGIERLGETPYTKYQVIVYTKMGVHGIVDFVSNDLHSYQLRDIVKFVWSKKHDRVFQYPVVKEEEREKAERLYWLNAQLLWQEELHNN